MAKTFDEVIDLFEKARIDVRGLYWSGEDGSPDFYVRGKGEQGLRRVTGVEYKVNTDGKREIIVEVEV